MYATKLAVSLVSTVLNDKSGCIAFFEQMEAQTHQPNEIVIVDGGSTDGTWEYLQSYQPNKPYSLRVFQESGCNVARGRNLAIIQSKHEIIVSTDIGCNWEPQWLDELTSPLKNNQDIEAVMGSWAVRWGDLSSDWAKAEYALLNGPKLSATPLSHASSRAIAYRKSLWEKIGGYPEDLTLAGDDMVFALLLHQTTDQVSAAPVPRCYWERPATLKSFGKEARRNFRGGGEAGIWLNHGILVGGRLLMEPVLLLLGLFFLFQKSSRALGLLCAGGFLASVSQRLIKLAPAVRCIRSKRVSGGWLKILVFEYFVKFCGVIGYWEGFIDGFKNCSNCRTRLGTEFKVTVTHKEDVT